MTRLPLILICLTALAACGADGEPEQPRPNDGGTGVRVSGDAIVGISVSSSGTRSYGAVTLSQGPFTLGLGF
jgi:hypothetical protein